MSLCSPPSSGSALTSLHIKPKFFTMVHRACFIYAWLTHSRPSCCSIHSSGMLLPQGPYTCGSFCLEGLSPDDHSAHSLAFLRTLLKHPFSMRPHFTLQTRSSYSALFLSLALITICQAMLLLFILSWSISPL
jgi:hypothetical protein